MTIAEAPTLGDKLKKRRKEMNVALKEAETATSIRATYLQAIEEGKTNQLISPIYAQGFIKHYATFLGLDGDLLLREHPEFLQRGCQHEFSYGIGTLEMRTPHGTGMKSFPGIVWIALIIFLFLAAWYLAYLLEVI